MKTKTTTNATNEQNTNKNPLVSTIEKFERLYMTDTDSPEYATALTELAQAVTFSVLKKLRIVSGNIGLTSAFSREIMTDINGLECLTECTNNEYDMTFNKNGDIEYRVNLDMVDGIKRYNTPISDGYDLLQVATIAILDECEKAQKRGPLKIGFFVKPYKIRKLTKKIYIDHDQPQEWTDTDTTPIQECFKAVRREIENSRAVQVNNKYVYLEDIATDTDSDTDSRIYKRLPKYSTLTTEITDITDKKITAVVADESALNYTDKIISALQLTKNQAQIVKYRMSGYGFRAIATKCGTSPQAVDNTLQRVQKRAKKIGLSPDNINPDRLKKIL